ncbi:PE-PGRS family protein [Amycolatopsis sp. NPDC059657]|uniref:PE-PGRS family protein n=1 Tax=Amycolatopsis sp. NPDC059657 TaxID=3346899 RepID=UPI0036707C9E
MVERAVPAADVRYEWYSHQAMAAEVADGNDPAAAGEIGGQWGELAERLAESRLSFAAFSAHSEEQWQGAGGDAMRGALTRATAWLDHAVSVSASVAESVGQQAGVAARARADMPPPVDYDPAGMIRTAAASGSLVAMAGLADAMADRRAASEAARRRAIDVMNTRDSALGQLAGQPSFDRPPSLGTS